jgi:hypothetical protein
VSNIRAPGAPPFLDRSVHYDRLTPAQALELRDYARVAAMQVLLDVNRRAIELTASTPEVTEARRVNFGVYLFDENEDPGFGAAS